MVELKSNTLKEDDQVIDKLGNTYIVAYIEDLKRLMLDENKGLFSKIFEIDEFKVFKPKTINKI